MQPLSVRSARWFSLLRRGAGGVIPDDRSTRGHCSDQRDAIRGGGRLMFAYLRRLLPYVRPYWRLAVCSIWLTIAAAVFGLLSPWPLKVLVDNVIGQAPLPVAARLFAGLESHRLLLLTLTVVAGLVIAVVGAALHVFISYVNTKLEQRIIADFRGELFRHTERLSVAYRDQVSTGTADVRDQLRGGGRRHADSVHSAARAGRPDARRHGLDFVPDRQHPRLALDHRRAAAVLGDSLLRDAYPAAAAERQGHGGRLPVDRARRRIHAAGDHGVPARGPRGGALPDENGPRDRRPRRRHRPSDPLLAGGDHDDRHRHRHGDWRRRVPCHPRHHHGRRAPRRAGLHRRRLQAAGDDQLYGWRLAGQLRGPSDGVSHPRHRAGRAGSARAGVDRTGDRRGALRGRALRVPRDAPTR